MIDGADSKRFCSAIFCRKCVIYQTKHRLIICFHVKKLAEHNFPIDDYVKTIVSTISKNLTVGFFIKA